MSRLRVPGRSSAIRLVILVPFLLLSRERWTKFSTTADDPSIESNLSHRRLLQQFDTGNSSVSSAPGKENIVDASSGSCKNVLNHAGYGNECEYVKNRSGCLSGTLIEYLQYYYCSDPKFHVVGLVFLVLWILSLFYALGNTAADYFCPSLEELSDLLNLPPTVAGVTLLPLGNGAPDVFARSVFHVSLPHRIAIGGR